MNSIAIQPIAPIFGTCPYNRAAVIEQCEMCGIDESEESIEKNHDTGYYLCKGCKKAVHKFLESENIFSSNKLN